MSSAQPIEVPFGQTGLAAQVTWDLLAVDPATLAQTVSIPQGAPGAGVVDEGNGKYLVFVSPPPAGFPGGLYRFYDGVSGDAISTALAGPVAAAVPVQAAPTQPAGYPTSNDLQDLIESCGVVDTTAQAFRLVRLDAKVAAARAQFETRAGRRYGVTVPTTLGLDPPRGGKGILPLPRDLVRLDAVSINGQAAVIGRDVFPGPPEGGVDETPYAWLQFQACGFSLNLSPGALFPGGGLPPRCVSVTGLWGAAQAVPDDVWEAVLQKAARLAAPQIALQVSAGLYKVEDVQYAASGMSPLSAEGALWEATFAATADSKRRVVGYFG